jgi:hypothetical protein
VRLSADSVSGAKSGNLTITSFGVAKQNVALQGKVFSPPVVSSAIGMNATIGATFSHQIMATNEPSSYSATLLPTWLTLNASSGVISGTPTIAGNFSVIILAKNYAGTGQGMLTIRVLPPAPEITSPASTDVTVGGVLNYQITASNNPSTYSASGLPPGLTLNSTSGVISGVPTVIGNTNATISASNAGGMGSSTLRIRVLPMAPAITSPASADATVSSPFSYQITASNNATTFFAIGLPAGLTLNSTSGVVSGVPTMIGNKTANLYARNIGGRGWSILLIRVLPAPPRITSPSSSLSELKI